MISKLRYVLVIPHYHIPLYSIPSGTRSIHTYMYAAVKRMNYTILSYSFNSTLMIYFVNN